MYNSKGIYYTEEHSVSFGDVTTETKSGVTYNVFTDSANTWTTWHLIPASRISIAPPKVNTNYLELQEADGTYDRTEQLAKRVTYGLREGSMTFIEANGFHNWSVIYERISNFLNGKRLKMRLMDDPEYYYEGRFSINQWEDGADYSKITIGYQLNPYKIRIKAFTNSPVLWDPFNFETDYDYYTLFSAGNDVGPGSYYIYAEDYYDINPTVTWKSGSGTVTLNGQTVTLSSAGSAILIAKPKARNTLTITGTLHVNVMWRGGSL